jgi:hypothetical protein
METGPRAERQRRGGTDGEEGRTSARRRDTIVIRLPEIDPNLRDWLIDMIPGRGILRVLSDLPEEVLTHSRNARRERLLAARSFIDALIEETEQPTRRHGPAQEIEVE